MKSLSLYALPVVFAVSLSSCFTAPPKTYNYGGRYAGVGEDSSFQVHVNQTELNANLRFLTGQKSAGTGIGNVDHEGSLVFSFEDLSGNEGMGKLEPDGDHYQLSMSPTNVRNPQAAMLFGPKVLQKK